MFSFLILVFAAYVIGSIPTGLLIAKLWGESDIRRTGSGNIGATNVYRTLGLGAAVFVFMGDVFKGSIVVVMAPYFSNWEWVAPVAGLVSVLGHMYSLFLGFKGGKGVATSFGVFLIISPLAAISAFFIWIIVLIIFKWVSLASIASAVVLPVILCVTSSVKGSSLAALLIAFFVVVNHKDNIKRLLRGSEPKIGRK